MVRRAKGSHYENADGTRRVSVTSVLKIIDKPHVDRWAVNLERDLGIEASADLYQDLPLDCQRMSRMAYVETLRGRLGKTKAHQRESEKATDIGSAAHARFEWELRHRLGIKCGPQPVVTGEALWAYQECEKWWNDAGLEPVAIEEEVWSERYGYQGTMDLLLARTRARQLLLTDLKTSKRFYQEAELQVAAYAHAVNEMGKGPCDTGLIVRLPKHAKDPGFETREVPELSRLFPVFLNALELWKWNEEQDAKWKAENGRAA